MRNAKRMVATGTMMAAILFGTTMANAGIIIAGAARDQNPCTQESKKTSLVGIIIAGLVAAKTGIIIAGKDGVRTNCGIIIAG